MTDHRHGQNLQPLGHMARRLRGAAETAQTIGARGASDDRREDASAAGFVNSTAHSLKPGHVTGTNTGAPSSLEFKCKPDGSAGSEGYT